MKNDLSDSTRRLESLIETQTESVLDRLDQCSRALLDFLGETRRDILADRERIEGGLLTSLGEINGLLVALESSLEAL